MKLKKCIGVVFGACALAMLAGCYEPLEITDREMDMVAEYAAGVLIKHGTKATDVLLNREEQEEALAALATPTPRPTLAPVGDKEDTDPSADEKEDGDNTGRPKATPKPTPTSVPDNTELTMQDLTKLMDKEGFFFRYTGYESTPLYQGEGDLFAAAGDGKQLIVLKFEVTNQSGADATLVLNKGAAKEFVYTLRIGSRTIRPSLTLLEEDFYTSYHASYKPGETKNCVLVFECGEDVALDSMNLTVLRDVKGKEGAVLLKVK